jgi:HlyD family secretion protein
VSIAGCAGRKGAAGKPAYEYAVIARGAIEKAVSSSGKLEPVSSVSVLAQMSGTVEKVFADYNDRVTKGQVLAELNTDMLRLQQEKARAAVEKARATRDLNSINYGNQIKLAEKGLVSSFETKQAKTTLDVSSADLVSAEAELRVIETEINQYAFIKSPITGVVLQRNVDVGQNVVEGSSSNSSSLFTIAEDLTKMEIEATVDEVDIASIREGLPVRFAVEALPGKRFAGSVETIRLVPTTTDNVVSYTVIVSLANSDGALLPGMTADVSFIVSRRDDALLVPNAALRYEPTTLSPEEIAKRILEAELALLSPDEREKAIAANGSKNATPARPKNKSGGLFSLVSGPRPPRGIGQRGNGSRTKAADQAEGAPAAPAVKNLWVVNGNGELGVLRVAVGVSDGTNTEVTPVAGQDLDLEGMKVIVKEKAD